MTTVSVRYLKISIRGNPAKIRKEKMILEILGILEIFSVFSGIKVSKNGKNGTGILRLFARLEVVSARFGVVLARVSVGIGRRFCPIVENPFHIWALFA